MGEPFFFHCIFTSNDNKISVEHSRKVQDTTYLSGRGMRFGANLHEQRVSQQLLAVTQGSKSLQTLP